MKALFNSYCILISLLLSINWILPLLQMQMTDMDEAMAQAVDIGENDVS